MRPEGRLEELAADLAGPVKALWLKAVPAGGPQVAIALADAPRFMPATPGLVGRGVDWQPAAARRKAMMEVLERYCSCMPPRGPLCWGTASDVRATGAPVGAPDDAPRRWWVEGAGTRSQRCFLVSLEYVQLASLSTVEEPLVRADSTGMAVHPARESAVAAGISEVLERAGIEIALRARLGARWDLRTLPPEFAPLIGLLTEWGYSVTIASVYPVPSFIACAVFLHRRDDAGPGPWLVCGSGGGWSAGTAAERALFEGYAQLLHALEIWPDRTPRDLARPYDHFLHYLDATAAKSLLSAWGIAEAPAVPFPADPPGASAAEATLEAIAVDRGNVLTDYLGLSAMQVVMPGVPRLSPSSTAPGGMPHPFS